MTDFNTPWRLTAAAIYRAPDDARIWGTYEADVTKALKYIEKKKAHGLHLTLTQVIVACIARAYCKDVPELNVYMRRGRVIHRDRVGVFVAVELPGAREMSGFVIDGADTLSLQAISGIMETRVEDVRRRTGEGAAANKNWFARIPWLLRRPVFRVIHFIAITMGVSMPFLKLDAYSFGSVLLSNIGTHGLQYGMAAILPVSNLPAAILMGKVEKKPVVREGQIVIRDILPFSCTLDHRVCEGASGGKLAQAAQKYLDQPEILEASPLA